MPTINIERINKLDYRCSEAYKTLRTLRFRYESNNVYKFNT